MPNPPVLTQVLIKINGSNVSPEFNDALEEVVVDSTLNMPGMCSIRLYDPELTWADNESLSLGKTLEVSVQIETSPVVIFQGEITSLEPQFFSGEISRMQVRAYCKGHRLHRGRKTRTFLKMKDSDIISQLAGEAGVTADVDATQTKYDYVLQYNQTNMEFLYSRAERIGFQVLLDNNKLQFKKADYAGPTVTLTYGENLIEFEPRWNSAHQTDKATTKGWDMKTKEAITATSNASGTFNQGGMIKSGGAYALGYISSAEEVLVDQHPFNSGDATAIAKGAIDTSLRAFVEATGIAYGAPTLQAGCKVTVANIGTRFSGSYFVTSATHTYSAKEGYLTRFTITGRHPQTLANLVGGGSGVSEVGKIEGHAIGVVTNHKDPDNLGRVKVKYSWLGDIESDWVPVATPMAGGSRGIMFLPEVNDEVVVTFEDGDVHRPCVVGFLWNSTDKPPITNDDAASNGKVVKRIIKTRQGHTIQLDDTEGSEQILLKSKAGAQILMDDASGSENVTIKDKSGNNSMVIKTSDNSMTINVNGDFSVTAKGKITMKSNMEMSLESKMAASVKANTDLSVEGLNVSINGKTKAEMKGGMITINGSGKTDVQGGGMLTLKGAMVMIN